MRTSTPLILDHAVIATMNAGGDFYADGAMVIQDGRIVAIDSSAHIHQAYPDSTYEDLHGRLIMPGLVCAHTHFYGAFARGMAMPGPPPRTFVEILERLWWRLDKLLTPDDVASSAETFLVDAIRHGTTCLFDHHASPHAVDGSLDVIATAIEAAGVRGCLAYEVSDRDGAEIMRAGVRENERFARRVKVEQNESLAASFGLHASFTLAPDSLALCAEAGQKAGVGFHAHVAEDAADQADSLRKYRQRVVHRLAGSHVLGRQSIAAHCVHVDESEMDVLAHSGTHVVHNARSNMNNAVGVAPILGMLRRNIVLGLGNDGFSMNMFSEIKTAYLLHKNAASDPRVLPADDLMRVAFANNAALCDATFGPQLRLGRLEQGGVADLIVLDYDPPTPLTAAGFPWHLVFGIDGQMVRSTMVAGRWLMRDRQLLTLDEAEIAARSRQRAAALWKRAEA